MDNKGMVFYGKEDPTVYWCSHGGVLRVAEVGLLLMKFDRQEGS
jgi:hypothetical protein